MHNWSDAPTLRRDANHFLVITGFLYRCNPNEYHPALHIPLYKNICASMSHVNEVM